MKPNYNKIILEGLPLIIVGLMALSIWKVYYPALMSPDSFAQYRQALRGVYSDLHPPIMAKVLHCFMRLGRGIAAVTLLQSLFGCFGIYLLSKTILRFFRISGDISIWAPLILFLFLLTPLFPLPFFLMVFWKDSWLTIGILWITYLILQISQVKNRRSKKYYFLFYLLSLLMLFVILVRHNAIMLAPLFILILYSILYNPHTYQRPVRRIILCSYPILFYFIISYFINDVGVNKSDIPQNQIYASESLGVLVNDSNDKKYLPYIYGHLTLNYKELYKPAYVDLVLWYGKEKAVDKTFDIHNKELVSQYYTLFMNAPLALFKVKWDDFATMIIPFRPKYYCQMGLSPNPYGLVQNPKYNSIRETWNKATADLFYNNSGKTIARLCFNEHLIWIIVNLILTILFAIKGLRTYKIWVYILLIPLTYYASYLLATPMNDFRYMYPSTLLVQIMTFSLLVAFVSKRLLLKRTE
jgi:hypothetical protein